MAWGGASGGRTGYAGEEGGTSQLGPGSYVIFFDWKKIVDGSVALLKDKTVFKKCWNMYVIIQTAGSLAGWSF